MSEQFLHCADVIAGFEQMSRETMSKSMARNPLVQASLGDCGLNRVLNRTFVNMVTPLAATWVSRIDAQLS